ncbi:MAG: LLM class flavin-dependent oxidoreductase [Myxococcota bacterium]
MRFDMRAPAESPAGIGDLYGAALEMVEWGERHGCLAVQVSEHHGSPDGYLPAPLILASAMAARTRRLPIQVAALIVPLHDPIELAEQMAVLDVLSEGRVSYVAAIGYRPEEFAMFGRDKRQRGRRMDACLEAMRRAWTGEAFEFEGRPVRVTPRPRTPGGPMLVLGGNSAPAVRRAARLGLGIIAEGGDPAVAEAYREECARLGTEPGLCVVPEAGTPTSVFVAEDPDRAWDALGPYLLHDARMYAEWMGPGHTSATRSDAHDVASLRAEAGAYRIVDPDAAVGLIRKHGILLLQPLCGGMPPDLAWPSLELVANAVLPKLGAGETDGA